MKILKEVPRNKLDLRRMTVIKFWKLDRGLENKGSPKWRKPEAGSFRP
jgi:hypothetical protein